MTPAVFDFLTIALSPFDECDRRWRCDYFLFFATDPPSHWLTALGRDATVDVLDYADALLSHKAYSIKDEALSYSQPL